MKHPFLANRVPKDTASERIKQVRDFLTSDGVCAIGLNGGEPTIHPHFSKYLEQISQNEKITRATIYTKIDSFW